MLILFQDLANVSKICIYLNNGREQNVTVKWTKLKKTIIRITKTNCVKTVKELTKKTQEVKLKKKKNTKAMLGFLFIPL